MSVIFYLAVWVLLGVLGLLFGRMKGRPGLGFALGFFLGPIGWIIVLLTPAQGAAKSDDPITPEYLARRAAVQDPKVKSAREEAWRKAQYGAEE